MYNINVYKINNITANIKQLPIKRDWMDSTFDKHAYNCFPLTLTNGLGWGISFPGDIVFKWDGINQSNGNHVQLIEGHEFAYTERENASISFKTGLMFITEENVSMLAMPIPNMFTEGIIPFTTLISTGFFRGEFPCAARVTKANEEIVLKANTPIIALMPISLSYLQNSKINIYNSDKIPTDSFKNSFKYSETLVELNKKGMWGNFYRNATDHKGNKIGSHEVKAIRLETINKYE
jgi:hypothetical protein